MFRGMHRGVCFAMVRRASILIFLIPHRVQDFLGMLRHDLSFRCATVVLHAATCHSDFRHMCSRLFVALYSVHDLP